MAKQDELKAIKQQILDNKITPELAVSATQLVFGDGNVDADIVFIGSAGKFLDEMLGLINLKRQDIYITNIVKYRPPENRDPLPEEKSAFLPYLESQLEVIQPKLVVTLGRHSLNCFLPDLQIGQVHGKLQTYNGRNFLPLFHPAAALYNGGMRQTLIDDFKLIPSIIKKIKSSK